MDNSPRDLQNYSYLTKTEFNNCFIIHSEYFSRSQRSFAIGLFAFLLTNVTQSRPQGFSVNGSAVVILACLSEWEGRAREYLAGGHHVRQLRIICETMN